MNSKSDYLLIMACSGRKLPTIGLIPAIERYDGVNYRVLKKAQREGYFPSNLDILIISAKYGLIKPETLIENYDLQMTNKRSLELRASVSQSLDKHLSNNQYSEIFLNLGKDYLKTISNSKYLTEFSGELVMGEGRIGQKMAQMKAWLINKKKQGGILTNGYK